MLFNSYIFILVFLPAALTGYFLLNHFNKNTLAKAFLLGMSLWFYGYFNYTYLLVILSSIAVNYAVVYRMRHADGEAHEDKGFLSSRKLWLFIGLAFDIGMLFYFKYFDFFLSNVNAVFKLDFNMRNILLPLGISFFTFQQISYVVDAYRGETDDETFLDYAVFVTFFPQLIAGPIVTHDELIPQIRDARRQRPDYENISRGLMIFTAGLFKKVIVADTFGGVADWGFGGIAGLSSIDAVLVMFSYTMQIYFDFSAYSDMAIGIGKMFNFELPVNFNSPYKSFSIIEFWQRWHMTLTRFLRKYIYFPLGGSKKGTVRTYVNIMIVFLVSGLWHGAAWTFILWGALHGLAQCLNRFFKKQYENFHKAFQWLITFVFVNATWLIFRASTISDIKLMLKRLLMGGFTISKSIGAAFGLDELNLFEDILHITRYTDKIPGFNILSFYLVAFLVVLNCKNVQERKYNLTAFNSIVTVVTLVWCICSLSGVMTFLYFNF